MEYVLQNFTSVTSRRIGLLRNLVADAPSDDRRMVAITTHKVASIGLMPVVEDPGEVIGDLWLLPCIKKLVLEGGR